MRIKRYRPAFVSGYDDEVAEVKTKEELLEVPFVARWTEPADPADEFEGFAVSDNCLVAFYRSRRDGSRIWWVVAMFLDGEGEASGWFGEPNYENPRE